MKQRELDYAKYAEVTFVQDWTQTAFDIAAALRKSKPGQRFTARVRELQCNPRRRTALGIADGDLCSPAGVREQALRDAAREVLASDSKMGKRLHQHKDTGHNRHLIE